MVGTLGKWIVYIRVSKIILLLRVQSNALMPNQAKMLPKRLSNAYWRQKLYLPPELNALNGKGVHVGEVFYRFRDKGFRN
ncbi:hypothetical protein D1627_08060 [Pontibacter oryzae]|uniref:Uncharacterized protein n=1 Tax=Pontibacter oryzae TaxID=2304593 RepID=A0A399SFG6_9BACT|nr:hypothetical protein D1627_08060 [Pontibacter oryzae]